MKRTLFIIKEQGQESGELPSFIKNLAQHDQTQLVLLHSGDMTNWAITKNLMVVGQPPECLISSEGKIIQSVSYQGMLEKIFEVDVALVI